MKRSTFIKNLIGFYGIAALPLELVKQYRKVYLLQCFVRGFQYYEGPKLISDINKTGLLELVREPKNKYDKNAIALHFNNKKIGFVPAESNEILAQLIDSQLLKIQAEVTHIEPKAASWENVHVGIYALKDIDSTNNPNDYERFGILETPAYYTLKSGKETYTRVYWEEIEDEVTDGQKDYYQELVNHSSTDEVYSLIHNHFPNPDAFQEAFQDSRLIIKKRDTFSFGGIDTLYEKINDQIVTLEHCFGEDGYIVANVDAVAKIPDRIEGFVEVIDKTGNVFYEIILKKSL